jgi:hypothetical protein
VVNTGPVSVQAPELHPVGCLLLLAAVSVAGEDRSAVTAASLGLDRADMQLPGARWICWRTWMIWASRSMSCQRGRGFTAAHPVEGSKSTNAGYRGVVDGGLEGSQGFGW